jgi:hypothetical protein
LFARPLVKTIFPFGPGMKVAEATVGIEVSTSAARTLIRTSRRVIKGSKLQQDDR